MLATSFQLITRLRPDCFTFSNTYHVNIVCIDILKIVNWKCTVSVIIHNNSSLSSGSRYCKPEVTAWWKVIITVFYTHFLSNVLKKNVFQKLAGLWIVGEVVNHVGLYRSKVAEGCSAFQRRSCVMLRYMVFLCEKITSCLGHNFVHATTAELSCHVQNCDLHTSSK